MKISAFILFGLVLGACQSKPMYTLSGQFQVKPKSSEMNFRTFDAPKDSILFVIPIDENKHFSLSGKQTKPRLIKGSLDKDYQEILLYLQNQNYHLISGQDRYYFVSDQPESLQNRYVKFQQELNQLNTAYANLCQGYDTITDIQQKAAVSERLSLFFKQINAHILQGIKQFSGTEIAQGILDQVLLFCREDYRFFSRAMEALGDTIPDSPLKYKILSAYEECKQKQLTGQAPHFTLPDKKGNKVSLTDFRGKYVLIDFWASWCAPCRSKNKELNKHYPEIKSNRLEIISISLDNNKQQWLEAVRTDGISWLQLADLKGFKDSEIRKAYKVEHVPTVYLIDPQGNVIATNPDLEEIKEMTGEPGH